jgi:hypothetical protein
VGLLLNAQLGARLGERLINAGGPAVHDGQVGAMLAKQPLDDLGGQVGVVPVAIAGDDDAHTGIVPGQ